MLVLVFIWVDAQRGGGAACNGGTRGRDPHPGLERNISVYLGSDTVDGAAA